MTLTGRLFRGNIDGAVIGPSSSTQGHVPTFGGANGKTIVDSGFTIEKSVPANAVFTDTVPTLTYDSAKKKLTVTY